MPNTGKEYGTIFCLNDSSHEAKWQVISWSYRDDKSAESNNAKSAKITPKIVSL